MSEKVKKGKRQKWIMEIRKRGKKKKEKKFREKREKEKNKNQKGKKRKRGQQMGWANVRHSRRGRS